MSKLTAVIKQFEQALSRLDEVLKEPKTDIVRDSAIKRFEIVFDLSWKAVKVFLEEKKGIVCRSPKECFRSAYQEKLLEYDNFWLELTDSRNDIVHVYGESEAEKVYGILPEALLRFKELLGALKS
ncbi:MAG: nucleotidyltransferase substrate binding protein [Parcubacteria group bacterium]|nr:nucleotidyltransferase substrate binding protein [Parcubacteria group bacterium]